MLPLRSCNWLEASASLSAPGGSSPVVRARVPEALKRAVAAIADQEHRKESDIVREALAAYVQGRVPS